MPHGYPTATTTNHATTGTKLETYQQLSIERGAHIEILGTAADQDGFSGEVLCRIGGELVAIRKEALKL